MRARIEAHAEECEALRRARSGLEAELEAEGRRSKFAGNAECARALAEERARRRAYEQLLTAAAPLLVPPGRLAGAARDAATAETLVGDPIAGDGIGLQPSDVRKRVAELTARLWRVDGAARSAADGDSGGARGRGERDAPFAPPHAPFPWTGRADASRVPAGRGARRPRAASPCRRLRPTGGTPRCPPA